MIMKSKSIELGFSFGFSNLESISFSVPVKMIIYTLSKNGIFKTGTYKTKVSSSRKYKTKVTA